MKEPEKFKTSSGHEPRARLHAGWSPVGQRKRRLAAARVAAAITAIFLVLAVTVDAYAEQFLAGLPSVQGLDVNNFRGDIVITDRSGKILADVGDNGEHRLIKPLKDISPKLIDATVAIEDKNFYTNPGFDAEGIARAALANYQSGQIVGGGSTITQQLAKQLLLTNEQTVQRKAKEVVLAYQLSKNYSKDQILELYLNNSYYGQLAYGIEAASQTYFNKKASELNLAQASMLAGLPQAPSQWDPTLHPQAAKNRQKQVLDSMVRLGFIAPDEANRAFAEQLSYSKPQNTFLAPHFVDFVRAELERLGFNTGHQQLFVRTTLDYEKQQLAEQVVRDNLNEVRWRDPGGILGSAQVAIEPKTGQVITMVGSPDYNGFSGQYNYAADVPRNPGSSIKVFTYAAVLAARKATVDTPVLDGPSPLVIPMPGGPDYKVTNYDKATHGICKLRECLGNSLNIPAVKVELSIGVPAVAQFYRSLGIYPRTDDEGTKAPLTHYGPSLTLGGYPITLIEEATGLATIANMGVYHPPTSVLQVSDIHGKVLYQADPDRTRRPALDPGVAFILADVMSNDFNRARIFGLGSALHLNSRRAAAKTGTTDDFKDALTIGFTPDLATVFWVGDVLDIRHTMVGNSDGIYVAAPAWHRFMEEALKDKPDTWYTPPGNVVPVAGGYVLTDATSISRLPNDNPTITPTPPDYFVPQQYLGGPQAVGTPEPPATPTPRPTPTARPSSDIPSRR
jgi:membrane peptidoglycan carboxypeptidase